MKFCTEYLLVNIFKCTELFPISTVKVKIWQIFMFYNANWTPPPGFKYINYGQKNFRNKTSQITFQDQASICCYIVKPGEKRPIFSIISNLISYRYFVQWNTCTEDTYISMHVKTRTSRSLKKKCSSAKLKIISSIRSPKETVAGAS